MEALREIKRDLLELKISQLRIERALLGDEEWKQSGLVHEVAELKLYKEKDEKFKQKVAGGVAVGIPVLTVFWHAFTEWIKTKFS